jgi:hypothetical protein
VISSWMTASSSAVMGRVRRPASSALNAAANEHGVQTAQAHQRRIVRNAGH